MTIFIQGESNTGCHPSGTYTFTGTRREKDKSRDKDRREKCHEIVKPAYTDTSTADDPVVLPCVCIKSC